MTDPVDTDALRVFGQEMRVELPEHSELADQVTAAADEVDRLRREVEVATSAARYQRRRAEDLYAALVDAPHEDDCPKEMARANRRDPNDRRCTCWKADEL